VRGRSGREDRVDETPPGCTDQPGEERREGKTLKDTTKERARRLERRDEVEGRHGAGRKKEGKGQETERESGFSFF